MPITLNGSTGVTYPDGVLQTSGVPAPGTAGNVLTSNGTIWTSAAAAAFDAGTRMMFAQTSAPTGWTKDTTNYNNHTLRVVTGAASTGGSVDFTTAFTSQTPTINTSGLSAGATTLSTTQIPSHTHTISGGPNNGDTSASFSQRGGPPQSTLTSNSTGGGSSHTHTISGSATSSAINLAVKYLDVITATKD